MNNRWSLNPVSAGTNGITRNQLNVPGTSFVSPAQGGGGHIIWQTNIEKQNQLQMAAKFLMIDFRFKIIHGN